MLRFLFFVIHIVLLNGIESEYEHFQFRKHLNRDIVKKLDAIIMLKVIGDDSGCATWVMDAKHGEGTITLINGSGLNKREK